MAAHSDGLGAPPPDGEDPMPKAITSKKTSSASPAVHDEEAATAKQRRAKTTDSESTVADGEEDAAQAESNRKIQAIKDLENKIYYTKYLDSKGREQTLSEAIDAGKAAERELDNARQYLEAIHRASEPDTTETGNAEVSTKDQEARDAKRTRRSHD